MKFILCALFVIICLVEINEATGTPGDICANRGTAVCCSGIGLNVPILCNVLQVGRTCSMYPESDSLYFTFCKFLYSCSNIFYKNAYHILGATTSCCTNTQTLTNSPTVVNFNLLGCSPIVS